MGDNLVGNLNSIIRGRAGAAKDLMDVLAVSPLSSQVNVLVDDSRSLDADEEEGMLTKKSNVMSGERRERLERSASLARLLPVEDATFLDHALSTAVRYLVHNCTSSGRKSLPLKKSLQAVVEYAMCTTSVNPERCVHLMMSLWFETETRGQSSALSSAMPCIALSAVFDVFRAA